MLINELHPINLSMLFSRAAIEADNYLLGKETTLDNIEKVTKIIEEHRSKDTDHLPNYTNFPYLSLEKALRLKDIQQISEFALEMTLLYYELRDFQKLPRERLESLRDFLCGGADEIGNDFYIKWKKRGMMNEFIRGISTCNLPYTSTNY